MLDRLPPQSIEAEQSILSACMCGAAKQAQYLVTPQDFYKTAHIQIFSTVIDLLAKGVDVELLSVHTALRESGLIEAVGGASYLSSLVTNVPAPSSLEYYCNIVKDKAVRRALIEKCNSIQNACHANENIESLIEQSKQLPRVANRQSSKKSVDLSNVYTFGGMLNSYRQYISTLKHNRFITGFDEIDKRIRGVGGGEVLFVIARAGAFKTAMLQSMLHRYIKNSAWAAVFFEIEMPVANVTERYLQSIDNSTGREIEELYKENDKEMIADLENKFANELRNLYTVPTKVSLENIKEYVTLIETEYKTKVGVIGIDYLGLMDHAGKGEYDQISSLAREIKHLAKDLNIPVVVLSQTSRKAGDGSQEVTMDMGRGSGAIEESADFLLGLWKDGDDVLCKILKNRKGASDSTWKIQINKEHFVFGNICLKYEAPKRTRKTI